MKQKIPLLDWLKKDEGCGFLPEIIRDFHCQKTLFKAFHRFYKINQPQPEKDGEYMYKNIRAFSWVDGNIYALDLFLHFMASHGYTLQKCKQNVKFCDLNETMEDFRKQELDEFKSILDERKGTEK
jgi:transcription elongation factor GreA-like protein